MQGPDGWDVCCRPPRRHQDFQDGLTPAETLVILRWNQAGIVTAILVQVLLVMVVLAGALVPGFALFDGAAGEVSARSHIVWMIAEVAAIFVGAMSIYFGLNYTSDGTIEKNVSRVRTFLTFYIVVLVIAFLANGTHTVLTFIEGANCTSTLCVSHYAFWITLVIVLIVLAIVEAWLVYRVYTYSQHLFYAIAHRPDVFSFSDEPDTEEPMEGKLTPLLAKIGARHGLKMN
jgi:lysylphosphatidylglycerol synthetase-like protein (DUF2156 family)